MTMGAAAAARWTEGMVTLTRRVTRTRVPAMLRGGPGRSDVLHQAGRWFVVHVESGYHVLCFAVESEALAAAETLLAEPLAWTEGPRTLEDWQQPYVNAVRSLFAGRLACCKARPEPMPTLYVDEMGAAR